MLVSEVVSLQKMVKAQGQAASELITYLNNAEDRRRNSRHSAQSSHSSHSGTVYHNASMGLLPDGTDEPAPELRRAREILSGVSPDSQADRELERLSVAYHQNNSPSESASSSVMYHHQPQMGMVHDPLNDQRHLVYPVGQTTGIDPFHSDHIHNIPYSRPLSNPNVMAEAPSQASPSSKDQTGSLWGGKKPRILLVEDDRTCARIGSKFLSNVDCSVETAVCLVPKTFSRCVCVADVSLFRKTGSKPSTRLTTRRTGSTSSLWTSSCRSSTACRRQP